MLKCNENESNLIHKTEFFRVDYCNLEKTLLIAQRIKDMRFGLLLDFHYSETWSDSKYQSKPVA
ncbi:MAG TPA: hypothetical protein ENG70_06065 [Candidatus Cloacimonetes bacterium]|nr:hypothetical protein [Candidatus Cloacimonadota bacterium]HEX38397.1 hypothetical protein [Candidatus Cloacimonadota bacterium]